MSVSRLLCMASEITLIPLLFWYKCNRHLNETMVTVTTLQEAHVLKYFCRQFYFHPITSSQFFCIINSHSHFTGLKSPISAQSHCPLTM